MAGTFESTIGKDGKHRFNLKAANGQVILTSQGYSSRAACLNGIESVRKHADRDAMFEKQPASDGKFYFVLKAANGEVIGTSQRYADEAGCDNGIDSVKRHAADARLVEA